MENKDFNILVKQILKDARAVAHEKVLSEYGDEFGPVDLGNFSDLKKVFVSPFNDALGTIKGALSKVSSRAWNTLEVAAKGIPSLVVPFLSTEYDKIFLKEEQRQQAIEQRYHEVFDKARKLWQGEAGKVAFMLNPFIYTAGKISNLSSQEALDVIDVLSGNNKEVVTRTNRLRKSLSLESKSLKGALLENIDSSIEDLLNDDSIRSAIMQSNIVRGIKTSARAMKNESLNDIKDIASDVSSAETIEELEKIFKKKFPPSSQESMKSSEKKAIEMSLISAIKDSTLKTIINTLQMQLMELEEIDVPEASDLIVVYQNVLSSIQDMRNH